MVDDCSKCDKCGCEEEEIDYLIACAECNSIEGGSSAKSGFCATCCRLHLEEFPSHWSSMEVQCSECEETESAATLYCGSCGQSLCEACDQKIHNKSKRAKHQRTSINLSRDLQIQTLLIINEELAIQISTNNATYDQFLTNLREKCVPHDPSTLLLVLRYAPLQQILNFDLHYQWDQFERKTSMPELFSNSLKFMPRLSQCYFFSMSEEKFSEENETLRNSYPQVKRHFNFISTQDQQEFGVKEIPFVVGNQETTNSPPSLPQGQVIELYTQIPLSQKAQQSTFQSTQQNQAQPSQLSSQQLNQNANLSLKQKKSPISNQHLWNNSSGNQGSQQQSNINIQIQQGQQQQSSQQFPLTSTSSKNPPPCGSTAEDSKNSYQNNSSTDQKLIHSQEGIEITKRLRIEASAEAEENRSLNALGLGNNPPSSSSAANAVQKKEKSLRGNQSFDDGFQVFSSSESHSNEGIQTYNLHNSSKYLFGNTSHLNNSNESNCILGNMVFQKNPNNYLHQQQQQQQNMFISNTSPEKGSIDTIQQQQQPPLPQLQNQQQATRKGSSIHSQQIPQLHSNQTSNRQSSPPPALRQGQKMIGNSPNIDNPKNNQENMSIPRQKRVFAEERKEEEIIFKNIIGPAPSQLKKQETLLPKKNENGSYSSDTSNKILNASKDSSGDNIDPEDNNILSKSLTIPFAKQSYSANEIKQKNSHNTYTCGMPFQQFQNPKTAPSSGNDHKTQIGIQTQLSFLAEKGELMIPKEVFLRIVQNNIIPGSLEKSCTDIFEEAQASGIIHQTIRTFANSIELHFVSLKLEYISLQSLIWIITSIKLDLMTPTDKLILSRIKECFGLKLTPKSWDMILNHLQHPTYLKSYSNGQNLLELPQLVVSKINDPLIGADTTVIYIKDKEWLPEDKGRIHESDKNWKLFKDFLEAYFKQPIPIPSSDDQISEDDRKNNSSSLSKKPSYFTTKIGKTSKKLANSQSNNNQASSSILSSQSQEQELRAIPGGRYGCVQYVKYCGPPQLQVLSLGRLSLFVQEAINCGIIRYHRTLLVKHTYNPTAAPEENSMLNESSSVFSTENSVQLEKSTYMLQRDVTVKHLQDALMEILVENPKGLSLVQIPQHLKKKVFFQFNLQELGFPKLKNFLQTMLDRISIELAGTNNSFAILKAGVSTAHITSLSSSGRDSKHLNQFLLDSGTIGADQMISCSSPQQSQQQINKNTMNLQQLSQHLISVQQPIQQNYPNQSIQSNSYMNQGYTNQISTQAPQSPVNSQNLTDAQQRGIEAQKAGPSNFDVLAVEKINELHEKVLFNIHLILKQKKEGIQIQNLYSALNKQMGVNFEFRLFGCMDFLGFLTSFAESAIDIECKQSTYLIYPKNHRFGFEGKQHQQQQQLQNDLSKQMISTQMQHLPPQQVQRIQQQQQQQLLQQQLQQQQNAVQFQERPDQIQQPFYPYNPQNQVYNQRQKGPQLGSDIQIQKHQNHGFQSPPGINPYQNPNLEQGQSYYMNKTATANYSKKRSMAVSQSASSILNSTTLNEATTNNNFHAPLLHPQQFIQNINSQQISNQQQQHLQLQQQQIMLMQQQQQQLLQDQQQYIPRNIAMTNSQQQQQIQLAQQQYQMLGYPNFMTNFNNNQNYQEQTGHTRSLSSQSNNTKSAGKTNNGGSGNVSSGQQNNLFMQNSNGNYQKLPQNQQNQQGYNAQNTTNTYFTPFNYQMDISQYQSVIHSRNPSKTQQRGDQSSMDIKENIGLIELLETDDNYSFRTQTDRTFIDDHLTSLNWSLSIVNPSLQSDRQREISSEFEQFPCDLSKITGKGSGGGGGGMQPISQIAAGSVGQNMSINMNNNLRMSGVLPFSGQSNGYLGTNVLNSTQNPNQISQMNSFYNLFSYPSANNNSFSKDSGLHPTERKM